MAKKSGKKAKYGTAIAAGAGLGAAAGALFVYPPCSNISGGSVEQCLPITAAASIGGAVSGAFLGLIFYGGYRLLKKYA